MFELRTHHVNGQRIAAAHAGPEDAPVAVMLHGFPEFRIAWEAVAERLSDRFHTVLPDGRGYGLSSKPDGVDAYRPKHLADDVVALIRAVSPNRHVLLCGHDWGASVAYAVAFRAPELVSRLVIANGAHPATFQRALLAGGRQAEASRYMHVLRDPASDARMSADGYAKTFRMLEKFSSAPWLDATTRERYREAWDGALPTMLHWYRATPLRVPPPDAAPEPYPFTDAVLERLRVRMPHLVLWGMDDTALLPEAREGLDLFAPDLTVREVEGASHWILHERPDAVAEAIRDWVR